MSNEQESSGTGDLNSTKGSDTSKKFSFSLSKKSKKTLKPAKKLEAFGQDATEKLNVNGHDTTPLEPLVIPVQEDARKSLQEQARLKRLQQQSKEDQAAIQALELEAQGEGQQQSSTSTSKIVIASSGNTFQRGNDNDDEHGDQLKQDLERLAEDVDVESDTYRKIPIQDFGAALLRGMGWTGTQSTKEEDHALPRPARLGLGATPKILDDMNLATHSRRPRRQDQVQRDEKLKQQREEYRQQQEAKLAMDKQRTMQVGSIVYAGTDDGGEVRRRAVLRQLQGVPGLNMVLVQMEGAHDTIKIKKGEIQLVDRSELETRPFQIPDAREQIERDGSDWRNHKTEEDDDTDRRRRRKQYEDEEDRRDKRRQGSSRRNNEPGYRSRSESDSEGGKPKRNRSDDRDRRRHSDSHERSSSSRRHKRDDRERSHSPESRRRSKEKTHKRRHRGDSDEEDGKKKRRRNDAITAETTKPQSTWVIPNIRVRVVTEKYGRRHYKQKGTVIDVTFKGTTTIKMDHNSQLLQIPERYLETALPKVGGNAIVLTGDNRLSKGRLLERDSRTCKGVIQVFEDLNTLTMSLDDIAEWVGPLDDDLLE